MEKRLHFIVSGRVQGVGYRYTVMHIAKQFGLTGFVRNLQDGTVEIEAQGENEILEKFRDEISSKRGFIQVENVKEGQIPPKKGERAFSIVR